MKFRTQYSTKTRFSVDPNIHPDTGEIMKSMTRQEHKEECDINSILARYERTGEYPPTRNGSYVVCNSTTYDEALHQVRQAQNAFQELPARIRDIYGNSPARFLEALDSNDPEFFALAQDYGLTKDQLPSIAQTLGVIAENTKKEKPQKTEGAGTST